MDTRVDPSMRYDLVVSTGRSPEGRQLEFDALVISNCDMPRFRPIEPSAVPL